VETEKRIFALLAANIGLRRKKEEEKKRGSQPPSKKGKGRERAAQFSECRDWEERKRGGEEKKGIFHHLSLNNPMGEKKKKGKRGISHVS